MKSRGESVVGSQYASLSVVSNRKKNFIFIFGFLFIIFIMNFVSSAHYVLGYVEDANDSVSPNGEEVLLWNASSTEDTGITSLIGAGGPSYQNNYYLIDCELMAIPCQVGDILSLKVKDAGFGRTSNTVNVTVSSAAYDLAANLSLNSPVFFDSIIVDDDLNLTANEIDLVTNSTRFVECTVIVTEQDLDSLQNIWSEFYDSASSFIGDIDDNNNHYTNISCVTNSSYGNINQTEVKCSYEVEYYANSENWNCHVNVADSYANTTGIDSTFVNTLLSIGIQDEIAFLDGTAGNFSAESEIQILNLGNSEIDLSVSGYAVTPGDNLAMSCDTGSETIAVEHEKYNFTFSNSEVWDPIEIDNVYTNLTGDAVVENFNLNFRQNDLINEAFRSAYFRIFIPEAIGGSCEGNIVFGAVSSI